MLNSVLLLSLGLVSSVLYVQCQEQAPTNLMVRQIGINRVNISWIPPPNPPSEGYLITNGNERPTRSSAGIKAASTAPTRAVGQRPGRVTYWLVALYGTPIVVGPVSGTVRDFSRPINITFSSLTATSVTISWIQPPFSLPMDEYRVELRRVTGAMQLCQVVEDDKSKMMAGISTVEFTNLQVFSIYNVTITVILPSGLNATLTPTVEFTTKAAAPTASPLLTTSSTSSRSVSVSWTQIRCIERNGPITNYTVEFQEVGGALVPGVVVNRTFTASGLTPYTNYTFRVAAVNDNGTGPFSDVTSILTEEETPGPVSNLAGTPKFTSIVLIWSPPQEPNGVIVSYEVTYTVNGDNTVRVNTSDLSTTFTIPSLTPQTRVSDITVTAYTRIGQGEPANLQHQTTFAVPAKVINAWVKSVSDSSVRVSWEIINDSTIINYTVYYFLNVTEDYEAEVNESIIVPSSVNSVVIRNLTESVITDYQFQVAATAEINGEVIMGERSAVRSVILPTTMSIATTTSTTSTQVSNGTTTMTCITYMCSRRDLSIAVGVTFILTFLLTVLLSTGINFIIYSVCNHRHEGNKKESIDCRGPADGMEMDVCAAYGHVTTTQMPQIADKVYDNI